MTYVYEEDDIVEKGVEKEIVVNMGRGNFIKPRINNDRCEWVDEFTKEIYPRREVKYEGDVQTVNIDEIVIQIE